MIWTIPNLLTLMRVVCIPIMVAAFYLPGPWSGQIAAVIFVIAAVTDWFDGWLARLLDQESEFGAFLDPVADKLIVATALIILVDRFQSVWLALAACVIVGREILISALREWMARRGDSQSVAVTVVAKFKTALQMVAITLLLWTVNTDWSDPLRQAAGIGLAVAVLLTLWSMWIYIRVLMDSMRTS